MMGEIVAPLAGAWIETIKLVLFVKKQKLSRPLRARGLKPAGAQIVAAFGKVAPLAGAWIETPTIH